MVLKADGRFSDPVAWHLLDPGERTVVEQARRRQPPLGCPDQMAYEWVGRINVDNGPEDPRHRRRRARPRCRAGRRARRRARRGRAADASARAGHFSRLTTRPRSATSSVALATWYWTAQRVAAVAVDLDGEPLRPALEAAGFDPALNTTWVWKALLAYLTEEAVEGSVGQVAKPSVRGSLLVDENQTCSLTVLVVMRRVMRVVLRLARQTDPLAGEPWVSTWSPQRLRTMLSANGFDVTSDADLLTLAGGLGLPPDGNASLRNGRVALAVRRSA